VFFTEAELLRALGSIILKSECDVSSVTLSFVSILELFLYENVEVVVPSVAMAPSSTEALVPKSFTPLMFYALIVLQAIAF
jgi:hypothetical protein